MPTRLPVDDQALALLYHARSATPFCSNDGEPCVSVPAGVDSRHVVPLRSAAFRDWVTANFYSEYEMAPSPTALRSALRTLEARARYGDVRPQKVDIRIGCEGDPFLPSKIIFDLANDYGEVVEITSRGWHTTDNLRHSFRQSPTTLPLPRPLESTTPSHQSLDALARLFLLSESARARAFVWLATALRPTGPYPILVVRGPAGSGKSILARALHAMIDPSSAPVRRLPESDREIVQLALQNWMLVFDQVHRIPPKISEALSAVSSGDALEIAQPDSRQPLTFQVARPVLLVAPIDEAEQAWTLPRSFSNRTLAIDLEPIGAQRPEAAIWSEFEAMRPTLVTALAETVATALRRIRDIDLANVGRFPDGAAWAAAAAPALGLTESAAAGALTDPDAIWMGADPLRDAVHALVGRDSAWTGDPAALLQQLRAIAPLAVLPAAPRGLEQALAGIAGIELSFSKGERGESVLTVARAGDAPQRATVVRR
jgi:hypothetical protein